MSEPSAMFDWIADEQRALWSDLDNAIRYAVNGVWSMQSAYVARRIVGAARLVGPTSPDSISWSLVGGGVYDTLIVAGGIDQGPLTDYYFREAESVMSKHGGTREQLRQRYARTVAAMSQPAEVRYIRGDDE